MPEVQLALVGSMASDDPEGWDFFNATIAHADGDPDIHILNNFNNVGAIEVNAFQSHSDVLDPEVHPRGLRADRLRGDLEGAAVHRRRRRRHPAADRGRRHRLSSSRASSSAPSARSRSCSDPELGKHARAARQGARAPALPDAALPARLPADLQRARASHERREPAQRTPLVLVSNRGPVTFHAGRRGPARLRRPGDGAHRAGLPPRSDLDRLGDERVRRRGLARARRAGVPRALARRAASTRCGWWSATPRPTTASTTCSPTRCCGSSSTTCGTSPTRRTSAARRSRRSSSATTSSTRTSRGRSSRRSRASRSRW